MGSFPPRKGDPPWDGRWPCPYMVRPFVDGTDHAVLVKDGKFTFHYGMPGIGVVCPGSGKDHVVV